MSGFKPIVIDLTGDSPFASPIKSPKSPSSVAKGKRPRGSHPRSQPRQRSAGKTAKSPMSPLLFGLGRLKTVRVKLELGTSSSAEPSGPIDKDAPKIANDQECESSDNDVLFEMIKAPRGFTTRGFTRASDIRRATGGPPHASLKQGIVLPPEKAPSQPSPT